MFINEDDVLLETLLYDFFIKNREHTSLELDILPTCNQQCSYCYLKKHEDELYPKEIRDITQVLNNLSVLLKYFQSKNAFFPEISLFSGELLSTDFAMQFFNTLLKNLQEYHLTNTIIIPSNMSFLYDKEYELYYSNLIDEFRNINIQLIFSASLDGKFLDSVNRTRMNSLQYTEEFYNSVFNFCKKYNYGFHPMVSALNIDKWIDNFNWYMEQLQKFGFTNNNHIKFLEVRDDNWDELSIQNLIKFLNYEIDWHIENTFSCNIEKFFIELLNISPTAKIPENIYLTENSQRYTCSIQRTLMIRLGDLSIIPCHRTSYSQFIYGKFVLDDKQQNILSIAAQNPELAISIYNGNPSVTQLYCDNCEYNYFCIKGCLGAQFEAKNNLFIPCDSVCKMLKTKYKFLINKYNSLGFFQWIKSNYPYNIQLNTFTQEALKFVEM